MAEPKRAVAVLNDLMFQVKIQEAARRSGTDIAFASSAEEALRQAQTQPALLILDLNFEAASPLDLISRLKADEATRQIHLLGYVSHVQVDRRQAAEAAGCDTVLARSAFVQNLPDIFARSGQL